MNKTEKEILIKEFADIETTLSVVKAKSINTHAADDLITEIKILNSLCQNFHDLLRNL